MLTGLNHDNLYKYLGYSIIVSWWGKLKIRLSADLLLDCDTLLGINCTALLCILNLHDIIRIINLCHCNDDIPGQLVCTDPESLVPELPHILHHKPLNKVIKIPLSFEI